MKNSASHKSVSTLLSLSIILSFTVSLCSMNTMKEMCDEMMMNHNSMAEMSHSSDHSDMTHIDSVPKADSKYCEMTIECECPTESEFIATIAPNILLKENVSAIIVSINETDANHLETFSSSNSTLSIQNSYSPPPLFLANESFLI